MNLLALGYSANFTCDTVRQDRTRNSLVENSSRFVTGLSNAPRKALSLRVISCRLIFQEVRWLPSCRFSGVRLTANSSTPGMNKHHHK